MLTKLELLVLHQARELAAETYNEVLLLGRKYNFDGIACQHATPENDLLKKIQRIESILSVVTEG